MTASLDELIARLEAASEGSRELDWELAGRPSFSDGSPDLNNPRYTTSLDAALSLVPEGANCHGYEASPFGINAYWSRNNVTDGRWLFEGSHETSVPIAFVIASLKARKAMG